jgi:hypothetical protein
VPPGWPGSRGTAPDPGAADGTRKDEITTSHACHLFRRPAR